MVRPTTSSTKQTLVSKPVTSPPKPQNMGLAKKLGIGLIAGAILGVLPRIPLAYRGSLRPISAESLLKGFQALPNTAISELIFLIPLGFIQDVLLTRAAKYVVKKLAPEKEKLLDSRAAKVARIAFISCFFLEELKDIFTRGDVALGASFLARYVGISVIKETGAGSLGALGGICGATLSTMLLIPSPK